MAIDRTTIMASEILMKRVADTIGKTDKNLTEFYNRAILNQLENDGDFTIRDLLEEEKESEAN